MIRMSSKEYRSQTEKRKKPSKKITPTFQPKMPPDGSVLHFVIPGPPHGYYAQAGRNKYAMSGSHRERTEAYRAYQLKVKEYALISKIPFPLSATKQFPILIRTIAYFKN